MTRYSTYFNIYYLLGGVLLLTASMSALVSAIICHFRFANGDHEWRWKSFLSSSSTGLALFVYTVVYFYTQLPSGASLTSTLLLLLLFFFFFSLLRDAAHVSSSS